MNCLFCDQTLTRYNPMSSSKAYCTHCRGGTNYSFYNNMTLGDCYMIDFPTGYYPGYYTAQLMLWSNEIIIHTYIWDDEEKADRARLFYRGILPNDFAPKNARQFIQRLLELKAFL